MKTIKYKFIPLEERSNEDLSELYASIHVGYYNVNTSEDRKKIIKLLSKELQRVKRFEVFELAIATVSKTQNRAANINCGELGILKMWFSDVWRHEWIEADFNFVLEVM